MPQILDEVCEKAARRRIPLTVHLDLTWRCNAHCIHCYLPDHGAGEMATAQVLHLIEELAGAGTLFLLISGGEALLRPDLFEIIERARALSFAVVLKTNGTLIDDQAAGRLAGLSLYRLDVSLYSHRAEVHDAITRLAGSWRRSVRAIQRLTAAGLKVRVVNVLMKANTGDEAALHEFARSLGASYTLDPTVTPRLDGDRTVTSLGLGLDELRSAFSEPFLAGVIRDLCEADGLPQAVRDSLLCSAGHYSCYVSPSGELFPCIQLPLSCGNVCEPGFKQAWGSQNMEAIRSLRLNDLKDCKGCALLATCTRCPGLALMEGDLAGKSTLDCLKATALATVISPA
jgi:radical SAM protein with 4Fe4S-binding SPASM domain